MKVIIAGSRDINDYELVKTEIQASKFDITEVVCGMAEGVDLLGKKWAEENKILVKEFPVTKEDWKRYGKFAGIRRNHQMGDYAEGLIAIRKDYSRGTTDMITYARQKKLQVYTKEI